MKTKLDELLEKWRESASHYYGGMSHEILRDLESIKDSLHEPVDAEALAKRFHETYERFAPMFNYRTKPETAVPWERVPEQNKNLMIAVCEEIFAKPSIKPFPRRTEEQEALKENFPRRPWVASCQYGMHMILSADNQILWRADWIPFPVLLAIVEAANGMNLEEPVEQDVTMHQCEYHADGGPCVHCGKTVSDTLLCESTTKPFPLEVSRTEEQEALERWMREVTDQLIDLVQVGPERKMAIDYAFSAYRKAIGKPLKD